MKLVPRVALFALVVAGVVATIFVLFLLAISSLRRSSDRETRSKEVTAATLQLETFVGDLETGLRGYIITGDSRFLQPWYTARARWPSAARNLERLVADDRAQERRARDVSSLIGGYVDDYATNVLYIATVSRKAAQSADVSAAGKDWTDRIRTRFERILAAENARSAERAASRRALARRVEAIGIAGLAGSALLVLLFGAWVARSVAHPVRLVSEGATAVAAGDFAVRLPEGGVGEIGALTRAFNAMTRALEQSRHELVAQNERLRESERHKTDLISMVSHELRTPLASVIGFITLLLRRDFEPAERRRYLEIVEAEARRLAALAEDFLDVQLLEEGRFELDVESLDIASLVREQAQLFFANAPDHAFELDAPRGAVVVHVDRDRLAQVVGNLLSNAIKYSPGGGLVRVEIVPNDSSVRLSVTDEGVGIPPSHRPRIFERFYRGAAATVGIGGTGLGLAVAREIVEAHGGTIGFESEEGVGSTFWFELPLTSAEAPDTAMSARAAR